MTKAGSSFMAMKRPGRELCLLSVLFALAMLPAFSAASAATSGDFRPTATMTSPRTDHAAALLPDGNVLIAGGSNGTAVIASAEVYGVTGSFSATGSMNTARRRFTATLLPTGKVLVAGGNGRLILAEQCRALRSAYRYVHQYRLDGVASRRPHGDSPSEWERSDYRRNRRRERYRGR